MIQPLKSAKIYWMVHWLDLDQPVATADAFTLPTVLFVTDGRGRPVGPPAVLDELDQARVESILLRLFDSEGPPDRLLVASSEEWNPADWESFGREQKIEVRIQPTLSSVAVELPAFAASLAQGLDPSQQHQADAPAIASGLVRSALRLRSTSKKEAILKKALSTDPDCAAARVELADMEFNRGNWKACLAAYDEVATREGRRWQTSQPAWWSNRDTRPYLRAIYGRAMTLWHRGRYADAAQELTRLTDINPADNQGARFFIPLLHLLGEDHPAAAAAYSEYAARYPRDFPEPALLFGWGLSRFIEGDESGARAKYREGILRNIYIAPLLLEEAPPPHHLWLPNDRAEYSYATEFLDSYAVLWDRDGGATRLVREVWEDAGPSVDQLVAHRSTMLDLQDQRYEPGYKVIWQRMLDEDERLCTQLSL